VTTDRERQEATSLWTVSHLEQRVRDLRAQLATVTARAEAAEAQLSLVDVYGQWCRNVPKPRTFSEWLARREQAASMVRGAGEALVERYGADQWRRGASNKEPQEFDEWRREQTSA
jgi:phage shock protein A